MIRIISGKSKISTSELANRCSLERHVFLNLPGALAFFEYLDIIVIENGYVIPSNRFLEFNKLDNTSILKILNSLSIEKLFSDNIFDINSTAFDTKTSKLILKPSSFPLSYASIRNFLILSGALNKDSCGEISIPKKYEKVWEDNFRSRKKAITIEQLLNNLEEQNKRGLAAEEFILKLEQARLPGKADQIKRISDFDVSAGYDIVSFESNLSERYDRYVEVKSFIGLPHFYWSENEVDFAKLNADKYILFLVDYSKIDTPGYIPECIRNPFDTIFNDTGWLVETSNYRIQKI